MKLTFIKGTAVGSAVAVAMLTATSALAGTGVGAVFNLGKTNTVNATSGLTGRAAGPMLNITAKGTGPALGLHVRAGEAPLTVSSTTQIPNLNASLLGGLNASNFVHGFGQTHEYGLALGTGQSATLLKIPGYGTLTGSCSAQRGARTYYHNGPIAVELSNTSLESQLLPSIVMGLLSASTTFQLSGSPKFFPALDEGMIRYTTVRVLFDVQHVARFEIASDFDGVNCQFIAEAYAGGGEIAP